MEFIDYIPKGKENRVDKAQIMKKGGIHDNETFKKCLQNARKNNIICFEDGYYRPSKQKEYDEFFLKCSRQINELRDLQKMAIKEASELNNYDEE
jgi:hypothetical protein